MPARANTVITLDGPAASGKSSVAKLLAARLGLAYVSSGLLYRAATHLALTAGVDLDDEAALLQLVDAAALELLPDPAGNRVLLDGEEVTHGLHTDAVDAAVSRVARQPGVRAWVKQRLRELPGSFVIDGRDMGTAVFPHARWKFYLTAPAAVRAIRRLGERSAELAEVTQSLILRDELDARQSVPAADAVHIDTGPLTLAEVVDKVHGLVLEGWPQPEALSERAAT